MYSAADNRSDVRRINEAIRDGKSVYVHDAPNHIRIIHSKTVEGFIQVKVLATGKWESLNGRGFTIN